MSRSISLLIILAALPLPDLHAQTNVLMREWAQHYQRDQAISSLPIAMAVDEEGFAYAGGYDDTIPVENVVIQYTPAGDTGWMASYRPTGRIVDMVTDSNGNLIVVGWALGTYRDMVTQKYSRAGDLLWEAVFNGPGGGYDEPGALTVNADGYIFVTGRSYVNETHLSDIFTIKYTPDGEELWTAFHNGPGSKVDGGEAIAVTPDGGACVAGSASAFRVAPVVIAICYDTAGSEIWSSIHQSAGDENVLDRPISIHVDEAANVYTALNTHEIILANGEIADQKHTTRVLKTTAAGAQEWIASYDGTDGRALPISAHLDDSGSIYLTGMDLVPREVWDEEEKEFRTLNISDAFIVKINQDGDTAWTDTYSAPVVNHDRPSQILVDAAGSVFVIGTTAFDGDYGVGVQEFMIVRFDADGRELGVERYSVEGAVTSDVPAAMLDGERNIYALLGVTNGNYVGMTMLKYAAASGSNAEEPERPIGAISAAHYPNPASERLALRYTLNRGAPLRIELYDVLGRVVETLVESPLQSAGTYHVECDVSHLSPGVYYYVIDAGANRLSGQVAVTR